LKSRFKTLLQNLLLLGIGILAALALAELAVRLFVPEYLTAPHPRGMYINEPTRGYALTPNFRAPLQSAEFKTSVAINSLGLRERELGPKPPGAYRILVLGDSFVFGQGVDAESTFPHLLESELTLRVPEVAWQVINAGVPGYGTDQQVAFLEELGWSLEPDLVIVALFAGNDVYDNSIGGQVRRSVRNGYLYDEHRAQEKAARSAFVGPVTSWLALHSRLYVFIRSQFDAVQWARGSRIPVPSEHLDALRLSPSANFMDGLARTETLLERMADQAAQHDARLLVVLLPAAIQVDDALWDRTLTLFHLSADEFDRAQLGKLFDQFTRRLGIPFLDLLPAMLSTYTGPPLYFETDIHWTAEGHRAAAPVIARYLIEVSDLLDRSS